MRRKARKPTPAWRRAALHRRESRSHRTDPDGGSTLPVRRVGLIVGNGLALDLQATFPELAQWNPSAPLSWQVSALDSPNVDLLDRMPRFQARAAELRAANRTLSDFDIIDSVSRLCGGKSDFQSCVTVAEMRHFLALAYATFQQQADQIDWGSWSWLEIVRTLGSRLKVVASFNYELGFERALETSQVQHWRVGLDQPNGLPVVKPHGSIDAALHPNSIVAPVGYPLANCIDRNDAPLVRLQKGQWLLPRTEVDIVLPLEESPYLDYQWVRPAYELFRRLGHALDTLVVVGISYWAVDRPEIDYLLDSVNAGAKVFLVNPRPPKDLMTKLQGRHKSVSLVDAKGLLEILT
jgi:hypothetical protein